MQIKVKKRLQEANRYTKMKMVLMSELEIKILKIDLVNSGLISLKYILLVWVLWLLCSESATCPFYNCRDGTNPIRADATLSKPYGNSTADAAGTGISEAGTEPNPGSNEPVRTNGKDLAKGCTADGRVRKGRGFTQQYSFARRYRTPSPERSPVRPHYNGGRNDRWGNFNRYGRYLLSIYHMFTYLILILESHDVQVWTKCSLWCTITSKEIPWLPKSK